MNEFSSQHVSRLRSVCLFGLIAGVCGALSGCASSLTPGFGPSPLSLSDAAPQVRAQSQVRPPAYQQPPQHPLTQGQVPTGEAAQGRVAMATYGTPSTPSTGSIVRTQFQAAEPRCEILESDRGQMEVIAPSGLDLVRLYPDEYLFDGGDRGMAVHYRSTQRLGVETEDTFAEYTDEEGEQHVRPSNVVAIFAPRFAAVRTESGPEAGVTIDRLGLAREAAPGATLRHNHTASRSRQRTRLGDVKTRARASAVELDQSGQQLAVRARAVRNVFSLKPLQATEEQRVAALNRGNEAWLAQRIQNALAWTRDQPAFTQTSSSAAMGVEASFRPQVQVGVEDQRAASQLRVIKLADKATAMQDDIVTFTLRYENTGDKELFNVRLIDNLTPRLEYVEDSAASDRDGDIYVEDNGEGSKVLRFEFDESIPGRATGVVTFQARVR